VTEVQRTLMEHLNQLDRFRDLEDVKVMMATNRPDNLIWRCCGLAGMFVLREERDYVVNEDFIKSVRKVASAKRLESRIDYRRS